MATRKKITDSTHYEVVYLSARRCCMCYALDADFSQKAGQIAHIDQDRTNESAANLAWLCLPHHDEYDSRTSQSKGFTQGEIRNYRDLLHVEVHRWRQSQPHHESPDAFRYKQQLIEQSTSLFFFAALAAREPILRKRLLGDLHDPDFKTQIIEAWAFIDSYDETTDEAPSREDMMAQYIGSTESGKEDLRILLGLAGAAITVMDESRRNEALFALQSDTIRSGLLLLHKLHTERSNGGASGA